MTADFFPVYCELKELGVTDFSSYAAVDAQLRAIGFDRSRRGSGSGYSRRDGRRQRGEMEGLACKPEEKPATEVATRPAVTANNRNVVTHLAPFRWNPPARTRAPLRTSNYRCLVQAESPTERGVAIVIQHYSCRDEQHTKTHNPNHIWIMTGRTG